MGYDQLNKFIELSDISFSYSTEKIIINNINLEIKEKSFFCIIGPSGCGKSTILKIISSMISPDKGNLKIKNILIDSPDPERVIIYQDDNQLFPWLTTLKNISLPMVLLRKNKVDKQSRNILKQVHLEGYENYYPFQLSGGMKKRAIIARALAGNPEVLLMDEPFSSLDARTRRSLHRLIHNIWKENNITVIFVTHDIDEAISLSTDIAVMKKNGDILKILKNKMTGSFDSFSPEFITLKKELYEMIESPNI